MRNKRTETETDWCEIALRGAMRNDQISWDDPLYASIKSSLSHREAQRNGADFEDTINAQLPELRSAGIATISKTGPVIKISKRNANGSFVVFFVDKGPSDYVGASLGCSVAIEAKSTKNKDAWSVSVDNMHQYEYMRDVVLTDPNAYAGYLIEWATLGEIRWHSLYGTKYRREEGMLLPDGKLKHIFERG